MMLIMIEITTMIITMIAIINDEHVFKHFVE